MKKKKKDYLTKEQELKGVQISHRQRWMPDETVH